METQLLVGAEDRNRSVELVERARMRLDVTLEFFLGGFELGRVDGKARPALGKGDFMNIERAFGTGDNRMAAADEAWRTTLDRISILVRLKSSIWPEMTASTSPASTALM